MTRPTAAVSEAVGPMPAFRTGVILKEMALFIFFAFLLPAPSQAAGPLSPDQVRACESLAASGPELRPDVKAETLAAPAEDAARYPLRLQVSLWIVNHTGFFDAPLDENELAYHLGQARAAFHRCGIEVVVRSAKHVVVPGFLDKLDRGIDFGDRLGPRQKCLFSLAHDDGVVNVYFVGSVSSDKGAETSYALAPRTFDGGEYSNEPERRFAGSIVITDGSRSSVNETRRRVALPHELAHVVLDANHVEGLAYNVLQGEVERLSLDLTSDQCEAARRSGFVAARDHPIP